MVAEAEGGEGGDPGVRGPDADPQQDVGDRHLRDLHLGAVLVILPAGPEALHVHLLGLGPEGGLVSHHGPHNVHIEGADQDHGSEEVEDVGEEEEAPPVDILGEEVVAAGDQETLGRVVSPAEEGSHRYARGVGPEDQQQTERHAGSDLLPGEPLHQTSGSQGNVQLLLYLDDDVVSVVPDGHHGHDGARPEDGSETSVEPAGWKERTNQNGFSFLDLIQTHRKVPTSSISG